MSPLRILITGNRHWENHYIIETAIKQAVADSGRTMTANDVVIVHGDAIGADAHAATTAFKLCYQEEPHPADWKTHRRAAGPIRNTEMVALGADVCLAFPIGDSPGTRDCIRKATAAGIPVIVHEGATT